MASHETRGRHATDATKDREFEHSTFQSPEQTPHGRGKGSAACRSADRNVGDGERIASLLLGGLLLTVLPVRKFAAGIVGATIAGLLFRGFSGHCPLYGQLGVSSADAQRGAEMPMDRLESDGDPVAPR